MSCPQRARGDLASEPNADAKKDVHDVVGPNANYSRIFQDVVDWVSCLVVTKLTNIGQMISSTVAVGRRTVLPGAAGGGGGGGLVVWWVGGLVVGGWWLVVVGG